MTPKQTREFVLKSLARMSVARLRPDEFELTECAITLVSTPVVARTRTLRATWVAEDYRTWGGEDALVRSVQ